MDEKGFEPLTQNPLQRAQRDSYYFASLVQGRILLTRNLIKHRIVIGDLNISQHAQLDVMFRSIHVECSKCYWYVHYP